MDVNADGNVPQTAVRWHQTCAIQPLSTPILPYAYILIMDILYPQFGAIHFTYFTCFLQDDMHSNHVYSKL